MSVDREKQLQALVESYMYYARDLGLSEREVLDMVYFAARERGEKFRCLNCVYSRAHRAINEKTIEKEGRISIYARTCVFGIFYRHECPLQVRIVEKKAEQKV